MNTTFSDLGPQAFTCLHLIHDGNSDLIASAIVIENAPPSIHVTLRRMWVIEVNV